MKKYQLFELFLSLTMVYGIINFEGITKTLVPVLCLFTVFLCELFRNGSQKHLESRVDNGSNKRLP